MFVVVAWQFAYIQAAATLMSSWRQPPPVASLALRWLPLFTK